MEFDLLTYACQSFMGGLLLGLGFYLGVRSAREVHHYYHTDKPMEAKNVEEVKYNRSIPDPDYAPWYEQNK